MPNDFKKIYFTNDFSPQNVEKLQAGGWVLRNAHLAKSDSFVESADEYGGEVPDRYRKQSQVLAAVEVGISPELQKVIDDAKAECEKVVAENKDLQTQLESVIGERDELSTKVKEFDLQLVDLADQLSKEREAVKKLTTEKDALLAQVKELEVKVKKPTTAELKAAKTTEAEQNKE